MIIDGVAAAKNRLAGDQTAYRQARGAQERAEWSSHIRQDTIDAVTGSLTDPVLKGVAVIGPQGVGKTTLAHLAESRLAATTHIIRLRGGTTTTEVPYGALSVLMARLPAILSDSPLAIIQGLASIIASDAGERPVLIILDDLPGFDTMSTAVLMHLVLSDAAKILVLARHRSDLPEDLLWLAKDGLLSELELENFSRREVRALLEKALGGAVADTAAAALYTASGGNPLILHVTVSEQLRTENLQRRDGVWILVERINMAQAVSITEIVRATLNGESERIREGLEVLALIRQAPIAIVLTLLDQSVVAEIEDAGYLAISESAPHKTRLRQEYLGEVIRAGMDIRRRQEVYHRVASLALPDAEELDYEDLLGFAAWTLDCGETMAPAVALAAAQSAVRLFDPVLALRCANQIGRQDAQWLEAVQARSAAYMVLADYHNAVAVLDNVDKSVLELKTARSYAEYVSSLASSLLWVPGGYDRIPPLLAHARDELSARGRSNSDPAQAEQARNTLELAELGYHVHRGEYAKVSERLETVYQGHPDSMFRLNCGVLLVSTRAVTGREQDAITLAEELESAARHEHASLRNPETRSNGLFIALLWSGRWRECTAMLEKAMEGLPLATHYRGSEMELMLGLAYTYAGRGAQAISVLKAAIAQLEVRESFNSAKLAYSALAFAYAQVNDASKARHYLDRAEETNGQSMWIYSSMAEFCELMALRWMGDPEAKDHLIASARRDIAQGRVSTASISLFGATVHGNHDEYLLLEEVSAQRQGPMAELNATVARGSRTKNPLLMLQAAKMAQDLGLDAVESRCAVLALDFAHERSDARASREAQQRLDRLLQEVPVLPIVPHTIGVDLTARELQVAKLACRGLGNRAIAELIGVSVRTVEGHLYQVFAKLGITSRAELEQVLNI